MLIDNSISVISSIANPNKDILVKTGANIMNQGYNQFSSRSTAKDYNENNFVKSNTSVSNHSKLIIKNKEKSSNIGNSMLKVKGSSIPKNPKYSSIRPTDPSFKVRYI